MDHIGYRRAKKSQVKKISKPGEENYHIEVWQIWIEVRRDPEGPLPTSSYTTSTVPFTHSVK